MGARRILQAAGVAAVAAAGAGPAAAQQAKLHERVALIDLGASAEPADVEVRRQLGAKLIAAGLELVIGDGAEDALAGQASDSDALPLAAAIVEAQRAFGALDCAAATAASHTAIGLAAARQAAGLAVPELARAVTYVLLCADRAGDLGAAMTAAARLRSLGGSADVPADVWRKYPEVDAVLDRELVPLQITADVPGAAIWVDFRPVGAAPVAIALPAGDHVIAAAAGTRRGWAAGTAVRSQSQLAIPTQDRAGAWSELARRIASWQGKLPPPDELGWAMAKVRTRLAVVRSGNRVELWGRIGLAEPPRRLGGEDGSGTLAEADAVVAAAVDRARAWTDRAPDPDRPLLTEDRSGGGRTGDRRDPPTKWWVYGALAGALGAGLLVIYAADGGSDRQRVELRFP